MLIFGPFAFLKLTDILFNRYTVSRRTGPTLRVLLLFYRRHWLEKTVSCFALVAYNLHFLGHLEAFKPGPVIGICSVFANKNCAWSTLVGYFERLCLRVYRMTPHHQSRVNLENGLWLITFKILHLLNVMFVPLRIKAIRVLFHSYAWIILWNFKNN